MNGRNGQDGQNGLDGPHEQRVNADLSMTSMMSMTSVSPFAEIAANGAHALTGVACALLDRQVDRLARDFETGGGFTERLYNVRSEKRKITALRVVGGEGGEVNPRIMAIRYRLG